MAKDYKATVNADTTGVETQVESTTEVSEPIKETVKTFSVHEQCALSLAWGVCKRKKGTPFDNYSKYYNGEELAELYGIEFGESNQNAGEIALVLATQYLAETGFVVKNGDSKEFTETLKFKINPMDVPPIEHIGRKLLCIIIDLVSKERTGNPFYNGFRFYDRDEMNALFGINMRGEEANAKAVTWIESLGYHPRNLVQKIEKVESWI